MTAYDLMIRTNHLMICGGDIPDREKSYIARRLLDARSSSARVKRFYDDVRCSGVIENTSRIYPEFYIPPHNGKKLRTVTGQLPKTQILSSNMYELEILRLLVLFAPERTEVREMVGRTLARLRTTCFGAGGCIGGECHDTLLVVLRFIAAAAPWDMRWMRNLIYKFNRGAGKRKSPRALLWYYWLCLSELPPLVAVSELKRNRERVLRTLERLDRQGALIRGEADRERQTVGCCIMRNLLCGMAEYGYIKGRRPYVDADDGRLHFDMSRQIVTAENVSPCGRSCDFCNYRREGACRGCRQIGGREVALWRNGCKIYACSLEHFAWHCGLCEEFPCNLYLMATAACGQTGLEELRRLAGKDNNMKEIER